MKKTKSVHPAYAHLTNSAGAFAKPLEKDVEAWLKMGWVRVEKTETSLEGSSK
jgi:hypothetical protein